MKGCGCQSGLLRWVTPPMADYFYTACCMHDDAYDRGGTESGRKAADRELYFNMTLLVRRRESSPWRAALYVLVALLYYVCVRLFGRFYFTYKRETA